MQPDLLQHNGQGQAHSPATHSTHDNNMASIMPYLLAMPVHPSSADQDTKLARTSYHSYVLR